MIQFNLLPDVKIAFIKARHAKRLVILGAAIVTSIAVTVMVLLILAVHVVQKNHLKNLRNDIQAKGNQLREEPDLGKILTVQQQLNSLDGLHQNKPASERLGTYLSQVTPSDITISHFSADFDAKTMSFDGTAPSLKAVNKFIDTLKFTTYKSGDMTGNAFSAVVLASFSRAEQPTDNTSMATYQITLTYDQAIMNGIEDVSLVVPQTTTTRSSTQRPSGELFQQVTPDGAGGQ